MYLADALLGGAAGVPKPWFSYLVKTARLQISPNLSKAFNAKLYPT